MDQFVKQVIINPKQHKLCKAYPMPIQVQLGFGHL